MLGRNLELEFLGGIEFRDTKRLGEGKRLAIDRGAKKSLAESFSTRTRTKL